MNNENKKRRAALGDVSNDEKIQKHGGKRKCTILETKPVTAVSAQKFAKTSVNLTTEKTRFNPKLKPVVEDKAPEKPKEAAIQKPATQHKTCNVSKLCSPIQNLCVDKKTKAKCGETTKKTIAHKKQPEYKTTKSTSTKTTATTDNTFKTTNIIPITDISEEVTTQIIQVTYPPKHAQANKQPKTAKVVPYVKLTRVVVDKSTAAEATRSEPTKVIKVVRAERPFSCPEEPTEAATTQATTIKATTATKPIECVAANNRRLVKSEDSVNDKSEADITLSTTAATKLTTTLLVKSETNTTTTTKSTSTTATTTTSSANTKTKATTTPATTIKATTATKPIECFAANNRRLVKSEGSVNDESEADSTLSATTTTSSDTVTPTSYTDWIDIDAQETCLINRVYYMSEYVNDIFQNLKQEELKHRIHDYMPQQLEINNEMRMVLVDWLVEVQQSFELNHESLYIAVKLLDTYASRKYIPKNRLQLIGAVVLNLAAKFEERNPPAIDDFVYICDDAYSKEEVLQGEIEVLMVVEFNLSLPLSYTFLRRYAMCGRVDIITLTLSRFILESSLLHYHLVSKLESKMAAASLFIAMAMNGNNSWDATMVHYTGYTAEAISNEITQLNFIITNHPAEITTILSKYSHRIFHEVALINKLSTEFLLELIMLQ